MLPYAFPKPQAKLARLWPSRSRAFTGLPPPATEGFILTSKGTPTAFMLPLDRAPTVKSNNPMFGG